MINSEVTSKALGISISERFEVDDLGLCYMKHKPRLLTYVDQKSFVHQILENANVRVVFVNHELVDCLKDNRLQTVVVDDPRWAFYTLLNYVGQQRCEKRPSEIDSGLIRGNGCSISEHNVKIGKNCLLEPNVTILPDVELGDNCIVRAGAILGSPGFEHKRTSKGILSVFHDGHISIGNHVEIGPLNAIIKGVRFRPTIIGDETKLDAHIHFAHGAQIGSRGLIAASAMIAGSVSIGDDVWIGPGAVISNGLEIGNRASVTLGAVVTRNVPEGETVTGHFALPHKQFVVQYRRSLKP